MLHFNKGQRNGLMVLGFLIVIALLAPSIYRFQQNKGLLSFSQFEKEIYQVQKTRENRKVSDKNQAADSLFAFDPNTVSDTLMVSLGLSDKQRHQIINYRNKGGIFRNLDAFRQIYAIDPATFARLKDYVYISSEFSNPSASEIKSTQQKNDFAPKPIKTESRAKLDINLANAEALEGLKGVGKVLSGRIVAYREQLGGFVSVNQLTEVYGIKPEMYEVIAPQCELGPTKVKKLNLNLLSAKELEEHPYIGRERAKAIAKERTFNGPFKNINQWAERLHYDAPYTERLSRYISF